MRPLHRPFAFAIDCGGINAVRERPQLRLWPPTPVLRHILPVRLRLRALSAISPASLCLGNAAASAQIPPPRDSPGRHRRHHDQPRNPANLGPYFTLFLAGFAAHAIIRYRLMDIRIVIKRGVIYASGIAVAVALFVGFTILGRLFTGEQTDKISFSTATVIAVVTAVLFQPLNTVLRTLFNRYVYRRSYDYQRTIRDASRRLSTILDPLELLRQLVTVIESVLKVERVCVYLPSDDSPMNGLSMIAASGQWASDKSERGIPQLSPLMNYLERERRAFVRDDVVSSRDSFALAAGKELRELGGDAVLPLVQDHGVSGFLLVGPKLSGDPYFPEDMDLLSTLVSQATIALQNAQLYRQVVIANE